MKNAQRLLVEGNIFENNWADAQDGHAILFTPHSSQSGPQTVVQDITFTHNIVRHSGSAVDILGHDDEDHKIPPTLIQTVRIEIKDNLFDDISGARWGGDGRFIQLLVGTQYVTIDHNTAFQSGNILTFASQRWTFKSFVYQNNIAPYNSYGVHGDSIGWGIRVLNAYAPGYVFTANVIEANPGEIFPSGNFFPGKWAAVKFANQAAGDYRLCRGRANRYTLAPVAAHFSTWTSTAKTSALISMQLSLRRPGSSSHAETS